jgi:hypothetical protein
MRIARYPRTCSRPLARSGQTPTRMSAGMFAPSATSNERFGAPQGLPGTLEPQPPNQPANPLAGESAEGTMKMKGGSAGLWMIRSVWAKVLSPIMVGHPIL